MISKPENPVGAVLVVGGGIGGIQASLDLAESGYKVYLVDKAPYIGGRMAQLDKTFPTNDCSQCILAPKTIEVLHHPNIELITNAELKEVNGEKGNFKVKIIQKARYVDIEKCTGCARCQEVCPLKIDDPFNEKLSKTKCIRVPYPQAAPLKAIMDLELCSNFWSEKGKERCLNCEKYCEANAINSKQKDHEIYLNVGAIILSPGFKPFDPSKLKQYSYDHPDVITSMEFERILSANGPTQGHIIKPSNSEKPKKIGFIQCIGSRDKIIGYPICSSVCCAYATKQAIIAKEHDPDLNTYIFYIDMRTFGKGFEEYMERAKSEYGVKYIRSKISEVIPDPKTNKLLVSYVEGLESKEMDLDLVVLSVGLHPPEDIKKLAEICNLNLNDYGFFDTKPESSVETNVEGIYVCGVAQSPKDIPDTVSQGSAAASKVSSLLSEVRYTLVKEKEYPEEATISEEPRIGVFVCHCGSNIAGVVDVREVVEFCKTLPNVVYATDKVYACSSASTEEIKDEILKNKLNRVIVASCTPRTHEFLFQNVCREVGLNPYLFEMVNIREHCSWVHMHEKEKATEKAKDLIRMMVNKSTSLRPLYTQKIPVVENALVIGAGISGMTCALDIANQGFHVYLVEKEKEIGGILNKIKKLHNNVDPKKLIGDLKNKVLNHPNIELFTSATITEVEGSVGNFRAKVNDNVIEFASAIIATGSDVLIPAGLYNYDGKKIITQLELESRLDEDYDGKKVVFIQCVGARNEERPYCSRICCTVTMKDAIQVCERKGKAIILHRDIRTYGFSEELYDEARSKGVIFIRYDKESPPEINGSKVTVMDVDINAEIEIEADLVVLATPLIPNPDNHTLSRLFKVPLDDNGFFLEAHVKLRPVDFATDGVFLCGTAHGPKKIDECVSQASAAAIRASTILSRGYVETEANVAQVDEDLCIGCRTCDVCPFNAIEYIKKMVKLKETSYSTLKAHIKEASCKGCGKCVSICPNGAITLPRFTSSQIVSQLLAALETEAR